MAVVGARPAQLGLRHIALFVDELELCVEFYTQLIGMSVEWQPDADNVYLSGGCDNLALHRLQQASAMPANQKLDHIGFIVDEPNTVDQWFKFLSENQVAIKAEPRTHRDGARSLYCLDPAGTLVQIIYHPPISGLALGR